MLNIKIFIGVVKCTGVTFQTPVKYLKQTAQKHEN